MWEMREEIEREVDECGRSEYVSSTRGKRDGGREVEGIRTHTQ